MAKPQVSVRLRLGDKARLGPGKMALLAAVADTQSVHAAASAQGMSVRRAWLLLDSLNEAFNEVVVQAATTDLASGRADPADLTPFGQQLLSAYQRVQAKVDTAVENEFAEILDHLLGDNRFDDN